MADSRHFRHPRFKVALEGFSFELPQNWEITSYVLADPSREGCFSMSTEDGAQGQFSWRKVKAAPDIPRILEEVHRRWLIADETPKLRFTRHGHDGRVVLAHTKQGERFYASVFNLKKMYLCEWIFPKYTKDKADEVVPMLETFEDNPPDPKTGRKFFALFGLEMTVPKTYDFVSVEAYPSAVSMTFEDRRHYKITGHRFGMADIFMQGANLTNFYHRCLYARHYSILETKTVDPVCGHETSEIKYRARGKFGFDFLLGPWWHGFGSAFLKKSENRVYAFEHLVSHFSKEQEKLKDVFPQKLAERD